MKYILIVFLFIYGCTKVEEYSTVPNIEYNGFTISKDINNKDSSGILKLTFTDGEGDIGLGQGDTIYPYSKNSIHYFNLIVDYYKKSNGEYILFEQDPPAYYRIPPIYKKSYTEAPTKGEIEVNINYLSVVPFDTFQFSIYIFDRALNKSNIIRSGDIVLEK